MTTHRLDDVVAVHRVEAGIELHVKDGSRRVVLWLDDSAGLALADDITRLCERQLEAVAA